MHEILTLQLGHRANYLATHFWNAQESYFTYDAAATPSPVDHDVLFRPGLGLDGVETYTPRTVIYDLKGGFGGLRKWGGLYDQQLSLDDAANQQHSKAVWDGNVVLHQESQIQQSDYQRSLDDGISQEQTLTTEAVRYWSDFNRVYYHPRSIVQINDYELGSKLVPFENWDNGEELFASIDREEDILDRDLRSWAEECDQIQGAQILTSGDDAWGGFASRYAERLRDEYGKIGIWVWSIEEEKGKGLKTNQLSRLTNAAKTLREMSTHASMHIPLSVPAKLPQYVQMDRGSQWQTSALLSVAMETMALPSRLRSGDLKRGLLSDMEAALNVNGSQRIAQLQCSVLEPRPIPSDITHIIGIGDHRAPTGTSATHTLLWEDDRQDTYADLDIDMSHGYSAISRANGAYVSDHTFGAVACLRGQDVEETDKDEMNGDDIGHARKRARFDGGPVIERYHTPLKYPVLDSFPQIFATRTTFDSVAVSSSLATRSGISIGVKRMQSVVQRMVRLEEREALSNDLGEIAEAYEAGWGDRDDSEDD